MECYDPSAEPVAAPVQWLWLHFGEGNERMSRAQYAKLSVTVGWTEVDDDEWAEDMKRCGGDPVLGIDRAAFEKLYQDEEEEEEGAAAKDAVKARGTALYWQAGQEKRLQVERPLTQAQEEAKKRAMLRSNPGLRGSLYSLFTLDSTMIAMIAG